MDGFHRKQEYLESHFTEAAGMSVCMVDIKGAPVTFDFLRAESGIVFHGNADPWCRTDIAGTKCEELGLELVIVEKGNHSLETGNPIKDIQELGTIMYLRFFISAGLQRLIYLMIMRIKILRSQLL